MLQDRFDTTESRNDIHTVIIELPELAVVPL